MKRVRRGELNKLMDEKTLRTRIRCRYWLGAMFIAAAALTAGTYLNTLTPNYTISMTPDAAPAPVPVPPKTEGQWERGGGKI